MKRRTWKKAVSLFLSLVMVMASVTSVLAASPSDFADFPTGWSKEAVTAAVDNGLLIGRSADTIEPQGTLTRAEMATIINRAFGATVEADISGYTDVTADKWYYQEIAKAVNMETFQGNGDSTMRPDDPITREEVFAVIARSLVLETEDYSSLEKFQDASTVADWAKPYAAILVAKGYVNGDDLGQINPKSNITREEFAQIMHNVIKTYYVTSGTHTDAGADSVLIRTGGVTLSNVTIEGDLIIGDGVGQGDVTLNNVNIKGRLLARGGEGKVTLTNTKVGEGVVVKDVNGVVNFNNYRTEAPFANLLEITKATFRTRSTGSSSSSGGSNTTLYIISHYVEDPAGTVTVGGVKYRQESSFTGNAPVGSDITVPNALSIPGYVLNTTIGYGSRVGQTVQVTRNMVINLYYNLATQLVSVTFYDGVVEDDAKVINSANVAAGGMMTQNQINAALSGFTPYSINGYQDGSYTHVINPELWYVAEDGTWKPFDDTVIVNSDMNVYYAFKNLALFFDLKLGGLKLSQPVSFSVPYETDTRITDSIKDALTLGRNQIHAALSTDDLYVRALEQVGIETGLVDAQGNIKYTNVDVALHEIIDANEVDGEVKEFIETLIVENTDDEKIDSAIHLALGSSLVDDEILGGEAYDYALVKAYINNLTTAERIQLADDIHAILAQETFYRDFIDAYAQEHAEFRVTHENVDLIMALATAVNSYTYDELKERIRGTFGGLIDVIGDDVAEELLGDAQERYYQAAHEMWEDVHAHEDQTSYESTYPSYLTFKLDIIEHLFKKLYAESCANTVEKLKTESIYHYTENTYLQQWIDGTETDALLSALFVTVPKTDENVGYAFWPSTANESGFMHYYDYMLSRLILLDKAMLWYEENLTAEELEQLKTKMFEYAAESAKRISKMVDAYEQDGTLPFDLDIDQLMSIEAFANAYNKIEDRINDAIEQFKTSELYNPDWNAISFRNDVSYAEEAVSVLLGLDDPTFNLDTLMDRDQVFDDAGFTDYSYDGDADYGTVTVQAIEKILGEGAVRIRRYYQ